ncbi:dynein axonemal heavy chain 10-like [Liolophura sinensis]|uniref:dynein axonemal heavy chain 10-like n=1 Tax=Liolophura sinensis TaxID=3198878 RepID=UPI00315910DB
MNQQKRLEILLEENQEMTIFKTRDFKKTEEELKTDKETYEAALTEVQPWRASVEEILGKMVKSDLTELRSMMHPPQHVKTVCQCLPVLQGLHVDIENWKAVHATFSDTGFFRSLKALDLDSITHKQTAVIKDLLKNITEEEMLKVSSSGVGILKFLEAVLDYCEASRKAHLSKKKEKLIKTQEMHKVKKRELEKMGEEKVALETELRQLMGRPEASE